MTSLTKFVNLLASSKAPHTVLPHLCGTTLLASKKKNGSLRPITIGEAMHRLVSKCLARLICSDTLSILAPLQLGVNVKGCEIIIHSVSHLMNNAPSHQCWTLLLDFFNAFNNISRQAMFQEICFQLSSLSTWMESCYSCQQEDPLGPLGFALTLHPIVERIKEQVPTECLLPRRWYPHWDS